MRTHRIRAFDLDKQVMIEPFITVDNGKLTVDNRVDSDSRVVMMWFSGRKDINNKDIYEYDKVVAYISTEFYSLVKKEGVVVFIDNLGAFIVCVQSEKDSEHYYFSDFVTIEVVGYELPKGI